MRSVRYAWPTASPRQDRRRRSRHWVEIHPDQSLQITEARYCQDSSIRRVGAPAGFVGWFTPVSCYPARPIGAGSAARRETPPSSYAPCRLYGFKGLSPYALPNVIEVAEGIPFIKLTDWSEEALYALKGEITSRGVKAITGFDMPVFEKRRFQLGAAAESTFKQLFPDDETAYRAYFHSLYAR